MDYWQRIVDSRISRRRGLGALGAGAAAAAFLAACGGSDSSSGTSGGSSSDKSDLITKPVDTTKSARKGGTLRWSTGAVPIWRRVNCRNWIFISLSPADHC